MHLPEPKRQQRQRERDALNRFLAWLEFDEPNGDSYEVLTYGQWINLGHAFRRAAKLPKIHKAARAHFKSMLHSFGDSMRTDTRNDMTYIDGMRAIMGPWRGTGKVLYRGDCSQNHRYKTYGASWTTSKMVATAFAEFDRHTHGGGGVLLKTKAPARAIIAPIMDRGEHEYLVDRRQLGKVELVKRFPKADP